MFDRPEVLPEISVGVHEETESDADSQATDESFKPIKLDPNSMGHRQGRKRISSSEDEEKVPRRAE